MMYAFLDRPVGWLDEPHRFLLAAMRLWVERVRAGRCPCAALASGFEHRGIAPATGDFMMAMAALDRDAVTRLSFAPRCGATVGEDEARLLTLFDAGLTGSPDRLRRIAATIVSDDASLILATAVERVTAYLFDDIYLERDR